MAEECEFPPVSLTKFGVMSVFTWSVYPVYWCYRSWVRMRRQTGVSISPFWRAFLAPFFAYGLFRDVRIVAESKSIAVSWNEGVLAAAYLLLTAAAFLPSQWGILAFASFLPFVPVLQTVREMNARREVPETENARFRPIDVFAMLLGAGALAFVVVATLLLPALVQGL